MTDPSPPPTTAGRATRNGSSGSSKGGGSKKRKLQLLSMAIKKASKFDKDDTNETANKNNNSNQITTTTETQQHQTKGKLDSNKNSNTGDGDGVGAGKPSTETTDSSNTAVAAAAAPAKETNTTTASSDHHHHHHHHDHDHDDDDYSGMEWSSLFMELNIYKNKYGHANPSLEEATEMLQNDDSHGDEATTQYHLATWLQEQRDLYIERSLFGGRYPTTVQIQMLRSVGCTGFEETTDTADTTAATRTTTTTKEDMEVEEEEEEEKKPPAAEEEEDSKPAAEEREEDDEEDSKPAAEEEKEDEEKTKPAAANNKDGTTTNDGSSDGGEGGDAGDQSLVLPDVGTKIAVYWTDDEEYYEGEVTKTRKKKKTGQRGKNKNNKDLMEYWVTYLDGDNEWLDLTKTKFKFLNKTKTRKSPKRTTSSNSGGMKQEEEDEQNDSGSDDDDDDEDDDDDDNASVSGLVAKLSVGSRVSVWWPLEKEYFDATVDRIIVDEEEEDGSGNDDSGRRTRAGSKRTGSANTTISKPHFLMYDDGDVEWTNLLHKKFDLLDYDPDDDDGDWRDNKKRKKKTKKKKTKKTKVRKNPNRPYVPWEEHYQELQAYKKKYGHANPPLIREGNPAHFQLGMWLTGQQSAFRKGTINEEKKNKLRKLGCLGFDNKPKKNMKRTPQDQRQQKQIYMRWDDRLQELQKYKDEHNGDANPRKNMSEKSSGVPSIENSLAQWLQDQRKKYRKGTLSQKRIDKLHEMGCDGFGGENATGKLTRSRPHWDECYLELQEYKKKFGHANPKRAKGPYYKLGRWVSDQRQKFRDGKLTNPTLIQKLKDVGCQGFEENDEGERQQMWDDNIKKLRAYKEREGHANPRRVAGISKEDWKLASWVYYQQRQFAKGGMPPKKVNQLRKLGCEGFDG